MAMITSDNLEEEQPGLPEGEAPAVELSEEDLAAIEEAMRIAAEQEKQRIDALMAQTAMEIESKFNTLCANRNSKEQEWLEAMRLHLGPVATNYRHKPSNPLSNNRPKPNETHTHNIVKTKDEIALAQCIAKQFGGGEKNWDLQASASPKGPDGQPVDPLSAGQAAEAMEAEIEGQLEDCNYGYQSRLAIEDRVILGTGILKGPRNDLKHYKSYKSVGAQGVQQVVFQAAQRPSVVRVNPWFFFPDDSVTDIREAEFAIEVHLLNSTQMAKLALKGDGWNVEAITEVLQTKPIEYSSKNYTDFTNLSENTQAYKDKYVVIEYHGPVGMDVLGAASITPTYESPTQIYHGTLFVCQGKVLKVDLEVLDGCMELPYAVCVWEKDPSCIFGTGVPMRIAHHQKTIDKTLTMLLKNASLSSGPQVVIHKKTIHPSGEQPDWELRPNKIWYHNDMAQPDGAKAFNFFEIPNVTQALQNIINMTLEMAEVESGIPLIQAGLQSPSTAGTTATGHALLQEASTTVLDYKNEAWDDNITERVLSWMVDWNWQYNPRQDIRGDYELDVRSSSEYKNKITQIQNVEKLLLNAAQNPAVTEEVNVGELVRAQISMMQLPSKAIIKSAEQKQQEAEAKAAAGPGPEEMEIMLKQQELELKNKELELRVAELQFNMQQSHQQAAWENEERMAQAFARVEESRAQVIAAATEREIALLQLAAKSETDRAKILSELAKEKTTDAREKFLAGMEHSLELRKQWLAEKEMSVASKIGTGVASTV